MVDKYYRKIESVENEIENSIQISSILLKLKGYDDDLSKIENNENNITNNTNDITNNKNDINNNKNDIDNNKNDINNNKNDIDNDKNDITNNKNLINNNKNDVDNNKNDITNNQKGIYNNKNDITNNQKGVNNNKNDITNNQKSIYNNKNDIDNNKNNIRNNKNDINNNKNDINNNSTDINNLLSFYKLGEIYTYDIQNGYKFVDKNNHYHVFEKEIIYNFIKDSYLEVILKVLTRISNYILIGYFEILCNFYDDNNTLFYTISLSTAAGSINKLSTVKSVFMVHINKNMSKIKIDFFIKPKKGEEHRSATFTIVDINSHKIYIKYYKKN